LKKILFLTSEFPPQPGGIGNHAHQLARYLSEYYKVTVLADQRSSDGKEESLFDEHQPFIIKRIKRRTLILISYLIRIQASINLLKSNDLVLVSGKFPLWVGGLLSLVSNKPIVGIIHGSEVQLSNSIAKKLSNWALSRLDHVIAVSNFTLNLVDTLKLKSTSVIPNGLGIPTKRNQLMELAKSLNVADQVQFHGQLSEDKKLSLLQQSDIFMMLSEQTSTGDVEGFGIAILEANALGLPAIGSLNCGIEDAIKTKESGLLVDPHDTRQIVSAVQDIITNQNQYSQQAKAWSTHFTWDKIGAKYVEVLRKFV
jgi:phosphatidylinositol alpha-1,6-mannosyltransferase